MRFSNNLDKNINNAKVASFYRLVHIFTTRVPSDYFFFLFFLYIPYRKSQRKVLLKKLIYFSDAGRHSYLANFRGAIFEVDSIV